MRFVKSVAAERFDQGEKGFGILFFYPVFDTALHEIFFIALNFVHDLFAQHLAELIGLAPGEARQPDGDEQHLVLIHNHAIGFVQPFFQARVKVSHFFASVFGVDKFGDAIHRAWPVKRDHSHHVFDTRGLELFDVLTHLRAFKLEDTRRLATRQQFKGFLAFAVLLLVALDRVQRDFLQHNLFPARLLDELDRVIQNSEVGKAQEVKLDQAQFFEVRLLVLCDASFRGVFGVAQLQRHEMFQRFVRHNHARRVHSR